MDFSKKRKSKSSGSGLSSNVVAAGLVLVAILSLGGGVAAYHVSSGGVEKTSALSVEDEEQYSELQDAVEEQVYQYFYTNDIGDVISESDKDDLVSLIMKGLAQNGVLSSSLNNTEQLEVQTMIDQAVNNALIKSNINTQSSIDSYTSIITEDLKKYFSEQISSEIQAQILANSSDIANLKSYIATLQSQVNSQSTVTNTQKQELTNLINELKNLSNTQKNELLALIEQNGGDTKSVTDAINAYLESLTNTVNNNNAATELALSELSVSSASSVEDLNNSLTELINKNKALSDESKAQLLEIISNNQNASEESITNLYNQLSEAINNASELSASERQSIINSVSSLTSSTAAELASLDSKYSVYYEVPFSESLSWGSDTASVTFTSSVLKATSRISITYDSSCTGGYTVAYDQADGSLTLTLTKNKDATVPTTLSGTLYIDNSMDNAQ